MRKRFARIKSKEKLLQQQRRKKHIKLTAGSDTVNQTQNKNENEKEGAVSYAEDRLIAGEKQSFMSAGTQLKQKSEKLRKKQAQISAVQRKNRNVNRSYQRSIFRRRGETAAQQGVKRAKQTAKRIKNAFEMLIASSGLVIGIIVVIIPICAAAALWGDNDIDEAASEEGAALVMIASSQIGNEGGELYWRWYGFSSHVDWCAVFVSWCAEQAGLLDDGSMPKFAVCDDGIRWFIENGRWFNRSIEPQPGMVIFFDWNGDGRSDHVGIVEKCEDGLIYTIEGNSNDVCMEKWYAEGDKVIMGYGV